MSTDFMVVHRKLSRLILVFAVAIAAVIAFPDSQAFAYSVSGVVKDISGNVLIADATVTVKSSADPSSNYTATTSAAADGSGNNYIVTLPSAGEFYIYSATKAGYEESFPPSFPFTVSDTSPNFLADPIFLTQGGTHALQLQQGWNLISVPLHPYNTAIATALFDVSGQFTIVWAYDTTSGWKKYQPGKPSDLSLMEEGKAYWIYMTQAATLTNQGMTASKSINLKSGWNFIGYSKTISGIPIATDLASCSGSFTIVWGYQSGWMKYQPGKPSDLTSLAPGYGYWVLATQDCTLLYP
jgi:hypothetical protein